METAALSQRTNKKGRGVRRKEQIVLEPTQLAGWKKDGGNCATDGAQLSIKELEGGGGS